MSRIIDRKGQKFNKWTILEFDKLNSKGSAMWFCRCECGLEKSLVISNVTNGQSKCCKFCSNNKNYKEGIIPTPVWRTINNNAQKKNRKIYITKEFAESLFLKQNKLCAISGLPIQFAKSNKDYSKGLQTASLDRINSLKNYTEDNVQWVHKDINKMKNVFSMEQLLEYCKQIVNHHNKNTN